MLLLRLWVPDVVRHIPTGSGARESRAANPRFEACRRIGQVRKLVDVRALVPQLAVAVVRGFDPAVVSPSATPFSILRSVNGNRQASCVVSVVVSFSRQTPPTSLGNLNADAQDRA